MNEIIGELKKERKRLEEEIKKTGYDEKKIRPLFKDVSIIKSKLISGATFSRPHVIEALSKKKICYLEFINGTVFGKLYDKYYKYIRMLDSLKDVNETIRILENTLKETNKILSKHAMAILS